MFDLLCRIVADSEVYSFATRPESEALRMSQQAHKVLLMLLLLLLMLMMLLLLLLMLMLLLLLLLLLLLYNG
jgi:hypothetical protein